MEAQGRSCVAWHPDRLLTTPPLSPHYHPLSQKQVDVEAQGRSCVAWHPDGSLLAAPGKDNDATLYERLSWTEQASLMGGHSSPVVALAFSPNGKCEWV